MLLQKTNTPIISSRVFDKQDFGIARQNLPTITDILSTKLYGNKVRCVMKEIAANAQDSHWMTGVTEPIEITLPSSMKPILVIRDYGRGMSLDEVRTIFTQYGSSTKRDTNDAIGALGLGGKSPFCLTKSFNIRSTCEGVSSTYVAAINEEGLPQLSLINSDRFEEEDRVHRDGVEVSIPVDKNTVHEFARELDLFTFWTPKPLIHGGEIPEKDTSYEMTSQELQVTLYVRNRKKSNGYSNRMESSPAVIIMGGVPYPVDSQSLQLSKLEDKDSDTIDRFWSDNGLAVRIPIGAVAVSASRESLEYTPITIGYLQSIAQQLAINLSEHYTRDIQNCATFKEAAIAWDTLKSSVDASIISIIGASNAKWKNMSLTAHTSPDTKGCNLYQFKWRSSWRSTTDRDKIEKHNSRSLSFSRSEFYYHITDAKDESGYAKVSPSIYKRIKVVIAKLNHDSASVYLLTGTQQEVDDCISDVELWSHIKPANIKDVDIPKDFVSSTDGTYTNTYVAGLSFGLNPYGDSKKEIYKQIDEDPQRTDDIIYVPTASKTPYIVEPGDYNMADFKTDLYLYRDLIEKEDRKFWVLSKRLIKDVPNNWTSFWDWKANTHQAIIDNPLDFANALMAHNVSQYRGYSDFSAPDHIQNRLFSGYDGSTPLLLKVPCLKEVYDRYHNKFFGSSLVQMFNSLWKYPRTNQMTKETIEDIHKQVAKQTELAKADIEKVLNEHPLIGILGVSELEVDNNLNTLQTWEKKALKALLATLTT